MNTYKTFLPVFTGFYESILDDLYDFDEDELHYLNTDYESLSDKYDYQRARNDIAKLACAVLSGDKYKFEFENISSPQFYNYSNDSINCTVTVKDSFDAEYEKLKETKEFKDYIKEKFTSGPGFSSYYSADVHHDDWQEVREDNIGFILEYIYKDTSEVDLYYDIHDSFNKYEYINE